MSRVNKIDRPYDVFISHSGAPELARLLRSKLAKIGTPLWRFENLKVFLDLEQTRTGDYLSESISKAIQNSKYLLLLASPAAAQSKWVSKEVTLWLESGKPAAHILIIVLDGTIGWDKDQDDFDWAITDCIPRVLSKKYDGEPCWGNLSGISPKALTRVDKERLKGDVASVAARIMEIPKEKILKGEKKHWHHLLELSGSVVAALIVSLVMLAFLYDRVRKIPVDELYHKGITLIEQRRSLTQVREALDQVELALKQDPDHQEALLTKAFALTLLVGYGGSANPTADHEEAERALLSVKNKETSDYYHVKGRLVLFKDRDPRGAIFFLEKAVRLDPENIEARHSLANAHLFLGEHKQAEELCIQAIDIAFELSGGRKDKRYTRAEALLAWVYYHARDYQKAETLCLKILQTEDSSYDLANRYLGQIYTQLGYYDKAIVHFKAAGGDYIENTNLYGNLTCAIALKGDRDQANKRVQQLLERRELNYVSHYRLAQCYACLGETDKALAELRQAREDKGDVFVLWSAVDPLLSPLQSNPDFDEYLATLGLRKKAIQQTALSPTQATMVKSAR